MTPEQLHTIAVSLPKFVATEPTAFERGVAEELKALAEQIESEASILNSFH